MRDSLADKLSISCQEAIGGETARSIGTFSCSLVAHLNGVQVVGRSNRPTPTEEASPAVAGPFFMGGEGAERDDFGQFWLVIVPFCRFLTPFDGLGRATSSLSACTAPHNKLLS